MTDITNLTGGEHVTYMLTTIDNPWDPWEQYDEWYAWDYSHGYHTPSLLARVCQISDDLSEVDQTLAIQEAIAEIVTENVSAVHRRVLPGQVAREQQQM